MREVDWERHDKDGMGCVRGWRHGTGLEWERNGDMGWNGKEVEIWDGMGKIVETWCLDGMGKEGGVMRRGWERE